MPKEEPLYERFRQELLKTLTVENWKVLPNEKTLMERFGVSRNTLRHAIQLLADEHIVRPVQGVGTIVFPIPEIEKNSRILIVCDHNVMPYQQEVLNQLVYVMYSHHLNPMLVVLDKEKIDVERFDEMLKGCDGVVLECNSSFSKTIIDHVKQTGKKMICIRWQPFFFNEEKQIEYSNSISFVAEDVNMGYYKLVHYLLELGHRKIAYLGNINDVRRIPGIQWALSEYGLTMKQSLMVHLQNGYRKTGFDAMDKLLDRTRDFTAVVCHNDSVALGAEERLLIEGIKIPEDVSVTGFDNLAESQEYPVPLTTASGDIDTIIQEIIGYLFCRREDLDGPYKRLLEAKLIVRQSTGPVRK